MQSISMTQSFFSFFPLPFPGVSVCGVGERPERPVAGLPHRQQPDPDGPAHRGDGGDGGGRVLREREREIPRQREGFVANSRLKMLVV